MGLRASNRRQVLEALEIARRAVEAALDKQASDIVMLDTHQVCPFADYFVICTGVSDRQLEAIWQGIDKALQEQGVVLHHSEGTASSGWILLDFGDVIVHIFGPAEREYYQLDQLWEKAIPLVRIQ